MRTAVLAVAGVAALASVQAATSAKTASRIVDRTLLCTMTGVGYPDPVRILDVSASSQDPKISTLPAQIYASNGPGTFAGVTTGFDRDGTSRIGIVSWTRGCSATKLVVPLSGARLVGGPVASREQYNCTVPAKALVRVQGTFEAAVNVTRGRARGELILGSISITTTDRRPILYASLVDATGAARVFVSPSRCSEDS